jgi:hypothetical protein
MSSRDDFKHIDGIPLGFGLRASRIIPKGYHVLKRRGQVVWVGPIGAPIEDADCDCIVMHPDDWDRCVEAFKSYRADKK